MNIHKSYLSIVLLFLIFGLHSCRQKTFKSKRALYTYLKKEENGYIQSKHVNGSTYTVMYKPTDLLVLQELDTRTENELTELREKYRKYLYFTLQFSRHGKALLSNAADRQGFGRMVNQLSFGMGEKVHLYTREKDTLTLLDYHYPRMYGMHPSTNMLFVYPREEAYLNSEYLVLSIEDFGLNTGDLKFKFKTDKIKKEPQLHF